MSKQKHNVISSPMKGMGRPSSLKNTSGVYDHNPTPVLSKPRDMGPNSVPERFTEGLHGATPMAPMSGAQSIRNIGKPISGRG